MYLNIFECFYLSFVMREMQDYVRKINNTVWACCVLHNLLLSYDGNLCFDFIFISCFCDLTSTGLDKLWTKDDYLSCWCVVRLTNTIQLRSAIDKIPHS